MGRSSLRYFRLLPVALLPVYASGCALFVPDMLVSKNEVSLERAMIDLSCARATLQNENSRLQLRNGQLEDEVTVVLALKASTKGDSKLVVDASAQPTPIFAALGANYSDQLVQDRSRENTITIKYKNIYTAALNKPGIAKATKQGPDLNPYASDAAYVANPCQGTRTPFDYELYERTRSGRK